MNRKWKLNTSNRGKFAEFKTLFAAYDCELEISTIDLREIDADPLTVITHKASQLGEGVIVEDTSLEIEGAEFGIHVRWLLDHLRDYLGKKALWRVLLAYRKEGKVFIFEGLVEGHIVAPRGDGGFGFDPFFLPEGESLTLAESKPEAVNARAKAVNALLSNTPCATCDPILAWDGPWQNSH